MRFHPLTIPIAAVLVACESGGDTALDAGRDGVADGSTGIDSQTTDAASCVVDAGAQVQIAAYQALYDATYGSSAATFDAMAASGDAATYYTFQYVLDAAVSMYEATSDPKYLERALA